jgi:hypothetical protein
MSSSEPQLYVGHILPGSIFLLFAVVWSLRYGAALRRPRGSWMSAEAKAGGFLYRMQIVRLHGERAAPLLSVVNAALLSVGIFINIQGMWAQWSLYGLSGVTVMDHMDDAMHVCGYSLWVFVAVSEAVYYFSCGFFPPFAVHLAYCVACVSSGYMFSAHVRSNVPVDAYFHSILSQLYFLSGIVFFLESAFRNHSLLPFSRCVLFMTTGTWYIQIARSLYGDESMRWDTSNHHLVMMAAIVLAMHFILGLLCVSVAVTTGFFASRWVVVLDPPRWTLDPNRNAIEMATMLPHRDEVEDDPVADDDACQLHKSAAH